MCKARKIILAVIAAVLAAVLLVAALLLFPLTGKKHVEVWSAGQEFDLADIQTVEKTDDDFKILLFTDTQLWTDLSENSRCYKQMDALVEQTQPDLIVTLGDNLSAFASRFSIYNFVNKMDSYKIPWAPIFGNHDDEIPVNSLNWQGDRFMKSQYCLFQKGPSNLYGCGNYVVNITENGAPVYTLFLLDNGRYMEYDNGETKEVYMGYEQIAWYEWNVNGIAAAAGETVPSMVFTHFAPPQFKEAVEQYGVLDEETGVYTIPQEYGSGVCAYLPGCAPVDSGFFDKCKALGSTRYMFCGHDHENNAQVTFEGITMKYGLKTGPSPSLWNYAKEMGATVVTIGSAADGHPVTMEDVVMETSDGNNG